MGAWTEIVDFTFTANETSRAFSGLSITKNDFIKVVATITNGSSSSNLLALYPNTAAGVSGFDTTGNYTRQSITGAGTSVEAARSNINLLNVVGGSETTQIFAYIKMSENGKYNSFATRYDQITSSLIAGFVYTTSSNLTFNDTITSLTFTASVTNGLGTGSRIQIYRLDAEKVADITTTSNQTQVDISSLSIGKDSEYLLVSDIDNNDTSSNYFEFFVNDNTTSNTYYAQNIQGNGSTASAGRNNLADYSDVSASLKVLTYSHIKLSEIGAYTSQNYGIRDYGTSSPRLQNIFISSTSEAITSITKLNIKSFRTSGIKSGSRFILYKLK